MEQIPVEEKILVEIADIVTWKSRYLKEVQEYGYNEHLMDHNSLTYSNLTFRKCWQEGELTGIHTHVNLGNRRIMLHVGGIGGFHHLCTSHLQGWT